MSEDKLVNLDKFNTLLTIIKSRRSIRHFKKTPVPQEHIKLLVEAATWAPSACNKQMWEFIYVNDEDIKNGIDPESFKADLESSIFSGKEEFSKIDIQSKISFKKLVSYVDTYFKTYKMFDERRQLKRCLKARERMMSANALSKKQLSN